MLFVSKRALFLTLVACPLVLSGSSTLRGGVNMIEVSKDPEGSAGAPAGGDAAAGAPQAAPAPAGPPPAPEAAAPAPPPPPAPEAAAPAPPPAPPVQAGPPPGPPSADQQNQRAPPSGPPAPPAPTTTTPTPPGGQNQNNPPPPGPSTKPTPPADQQQKPDDNKPPPPKVDGPTKPNGMTKPGPGGGMPDGITKPTLGGPNNVTTLPGDANSIVGCTRMAGNNNCITVGGGNVPAPDISNSGQGTGNNNNNQMPNGNGGGASSSGGGGGGWPISTSAPAPPTAPIDSKCDLIGNSTMTGDATCADALPAYVKGTTDMAWAQQTPTEREESMNAFCQTTCGQSYTDILMARRRGCTPVTPRGHGTQVVPHGPALFPGTYPGLRLGCVVDPQDGVFCALKIASPGDGDCAFYMSCCYGELANSLDGNAPDTSFYAMLDQRCPGSAKYRTMTCV